MVHGLVKERGGKYGEGVGQPEKLDPLERVRASFESQGLMRLLGAKVAEVEEGTCTIKVPFGEELTQQERYFHGAVIGALGDNAGGYAVLTLASHDREVLTGEYKVNFLAPASGEKLVARGEFVVAGRRLFVCKAEVSAVSEAEETVCAALLQTVSLSPADTASP